MSIPTGFFTDLTKNYYGIDPASQSTEETQVSSALWKDFLSQIGGENDPYFTIISSQDEGSVRQSLTTLASAYMSPLTEEAINDISSLAHELVAQRGSALSDLTSKDATAIETLLKNLLASHTTSGDEFLLTILPSIADDIATASAKNQKLYLDFLSGKLDVTQLSEATVALSPEEVTGRQITYTIYDIMLALINYITQNQVLESEALEVLTKKKAEYIKLMDKMFIYQGKGTYDSGLNNVLGFSLAGTGSSYTAITGTSYDSTEDWAFTGTTPSTDPTEYKLGYANATLQDVFDYLKETGTIPSATGTTSFTLASSPFRTGTETVQVNGEDTSVPTLRQYRTTISITKNETTGKYVVSTTYGIYKISYTAEIVGTTVTLKFTADSSPLDARTSSQEVDIDSSLKDTLVNEALTSTFNSAYSQAQAAGWVPGSFDTRDSWTTDYQQTTLGETSSDSWKYYYLAKVMSVKIPWGYTKLDKYNIGILTGDSTSTSPSLTQLLSSVASTRAQQNKVLNTYLEAARSKRDVTSDTIDSQRILQSTAVSSKTSIIDFLQTFLRHLRNILTSIYR